MVYLVENLRQESDADGCWSKSMNFVQNHGQTFDFQGTNSQCLKIIKKNVSSNLKIKMILSFGIYPRKEISTTVIKS